MRRSSSKNKVLVPPRVGILDYGMGNLRSVAKAWEAAGASVLVSDDRAALRASDLLVVPGQGAFGAAVEVLNRRGLMPFLKDWLAEDRPFLGICLGLQILFDGSEEAPGVKGLGVLKGRVRRFRPTSKKMKVPHMGWNEASPRTGADLFRSVLPRADHFYFVHSFYADPKDRSVVWTETDYGGRFCSGVARGRMAAVQFHPEKSGAAGAAFLKAALQLVSKGR
jgi:imidazole glycerol phosphate synthase glutamine amidotransferase subunit